MAAVSLQGQAPAGLAGRDIDVREHVLLPDEHGQGSAADDHHHRSRYLSSLRTKVHMAAAADVCVRLDVQPVPAADVRGGHLGTDHRVE